MKLPSSPESGTILLKKHRWIYLNCFECAGKHITILTQEDFGSDFYNYKSFYNVVLLVFVDYDYRFLAADIRAQGRINDDDVFKSFAMYSALENNKLNLPDLKPLPITEKVE